MVLLLLFAVMRTAKLLFVLEHYDKPSEAVFLRYLTPHTKPSHLKKRESVPGKRRISFFPETAANNDDALLSRSIAKVTTTAGQAKQH